ncbi:MAG: response regulator transcription factor [Arachnia sp.]
MTPAHPSLRIAIADDAVLFREGLAGLLVRFGHTVTAQFEDAETLRESFVLMSDDQLPDLLVSDVRMPPGNDDDGLKAALEIRRQHPSLGILVLSQYLGNAYATKLLESGDVDGGAGGLGYLLKERISRVADFMTSATEVAQGRIVIDPTMIRHLISRERNHAILEKLTPREREVLELMAEGHTNETIAKTLFVTEAAVVKHTGALFGKLGLGQSGGNRRVKAVLTYLSSR